MNDHSDIDRVLDHWFEDGPSTMPDRVVDVVARRISLRPQRRSRRLLWRFPMRPAFTYGVAAAAAIALAVVGYNLLPKGPAVGGPHPSSATVASPNPGASHAPVVFNSGTFSVPLTLTLAEGWVPETVDTEYVEMRYRVATDFVIADLAHVTVSGPTEADAFIPIPADFASWVKSRPEFLAGEPRSVTFAGRTGTEIDVEWVWKDGATKRGIINYGRGGVLYDRFTNGTRSRFIVLPGTAGSGGILVFLETGYYQFDGAAAAVDQLLTTLHFTGS